MTQIYSYWIIFWGLAKSGWSGNEADAFQKFVSQFNIVLSGTFMPAELE